MSFPLRPGEEQLLHRGRRLSAAAAGQRHGGGAADRAPPAGWHCQPHRGQEERHAAHRQWPQPGGMAAAQRAGTGPGHRFRAPAAGKQVSASGCSWALGERMRNEENRVLSLKLPQERKFSWTLSFLICRRGKIK